MPPKGRRSKNKAPEPIDADADTVVQRKVEEDDSNKKQYCWKDGHQEIMADFWEDHPEFYDKSCDKYKDIQHKRAAVETFLVDMRNTFEEINKPIPTCE